MAVSPLATTATFSAARFSLSETESSRLVASSASYAKVYIEISAALHAFNDFSLSSVFSAGSVSPTGSGKVLLTFTASALVSPMSIASLTAALLSLLLSLMGLAPLLESR